MLVKVQEWSTEERALQFVTSLWDQAVEILGHLTLVQRSSYSDVVSPLWPPPAS